MRVFYLLVPALLGLPSLALASQPGQPLDCSDWVLLAPGYSCSVESSLGSLQPNSAFLMQGSNMATDNTGAMLTVRSILLSGGSSELSHRYRIEVVRFQGGTEHILAQIEPRTQDGCTDQIRAQNGSTVSGFDPEKGYYTGMSLPNLATFEPINGRLLIPLETSCSDAWNGACSGTSYASCEDGDQQWWIAAIEGFATTFEVAQTYEPSTSSLAIRVPAHPENLESADHFDTYYGTLPLDFSQAQPLQCDYPATPPQPGDYLTVADTVPDPPVGEVVYYVTAVTSPSGETRFGRKASGGVLSGRNPSVLPDCTGASSSTRTLTYETRARQL